MQDRYYSRLGGTDYRFEIFKVSRTCGKIKNTQGQMEGMEDLRCPKLDGKDERLGILTFKEKWGKLEILKVGWNGWKIRNTVGLGTRMHDR